MADKTEDGSRKPLAIEMMGEDVPIDDDEEVDIQMRRIKVIKGLNPEKCRRININACLLEDMEGVKDLINLEVLELSENHLTKITGLSKLTKIRHLDLGFNQIKSAGGLESIVDTIEILRLQNNRIHLIPECIGRMKNLRELELGSNKIKKIENLPTENLKQLWLGRNHLKDESILEFNLTFPKLEILSLQNNALTRFPAKFIILAPRLQELYLSENFIVEPPCDLMGLENLTHLDLSYNKIHEIGDVIPQMINLKELWLNNNNIIDFKEVEKLGSLRNLESLYLEGNPVKDNLGPGYRQAILNILPNLQQVDAVYLGQVVVRSEK